jgi:hypothetical protein
MVEDLVISSYKEQIKESLLKNKAVDLAGFSVIVSELERRGIDTSRVVAFFNKIKKSTTKEELDNLTVDELNSINADLNEQITKTLISPVDISDILIRKAKVVATEMSVDGRVMPNDKFLQVGNNLASDINQNGIAHGIDVCIKNYTIQKLYQAEYNKKIKEKEMELGIAVEEEKKEIVPKKRIDTRKSKLMKEIFNKDINDVEDDFENIKNNYINHINKVIENLDNYK